MSFAGVYLSKTLHREDQPSHIIVHDTQLCIDRCYPTYQSPCTKFCPGEVYEIIVDEDSGSRRLKLNPSNCFHCKTCDVKDPFGNAWGIATHKEELSENEIAERAVEFFKSMEQGGDCA